MVLGAAQRHDDDPESSADFLSRYMDGADFRVSSGASLRSIPPIALIRIHASHDFGCHSSFYELVEIESMGPDSFEIPWPGR
jgi:hypothetical protein